MNNKTLVELDNLFKNIQLAHPQLNDYGFGPVYQFGNNRDVKYPILWTSIQQNNRYSKSPTQPYGRFKEFEVNYIFLIVDKLADIKVDQDLGERGTNGLEVTSDCLQIGNDILTLLASNTYFKSNKISVTLDPNWSPVYDDTPDRVNGIMLNVTVTCPFDLILCGTPIWDFSGDIPDLVPLIPGGGFNCDDLSGCLLIQNIQNDITTINASMSLIETELDTKLDCTGLTGCSVIQDIQQDILTNSNSTQTNAADIFTINASMSLIETELNDKLECGDLRFCQDIQDINSAIQGNTNDITTINASMSLIQQDLDTKLDCTGLTSCGVITDIQQDITNIGLTISNIESDILGLTHNGLTGLNDGDYLHLTQNEYTDIFNTFDISINFIDVETFNYRAPEDFVISSVVNPDGLSYSIDVNSTTYSIGATISYLDTLEIVPSSTGFLKLNCIK